MKNALIKFFLSFFKNKGTSTRSRILIVSTTGLGDTLWATPAIKALRERYPHSYIAAYTSSIGKQVLHNNPHLNALFTQKRDFLKLKKKQFETILIFHASQRYILPFCHLLGAPEIIGTTGLNKGLDFILTKQIANEKIHEVERRLKIIAELDATPQNPKLELYTEKKERQSLIGMHPGAKDSFKQWPASCFIEVGIALQQTGAQILITGSEIEKPLLIAIASQIPNAKILISSFAILAETISQMSVLITNDTGPMHVAAALNTPTVALFSPTDPKLCGPYNTSSAIIIQKPPTCTPCLRKKCRSAFCMMQIAPKEVIQAALALIVPVPEIKKEKPGTDTNKERKGACHDIDSRSV